MPISVRIAALLILPISLASAARGESLFTLEDEFARAEAIIQSQPPMGTPAYPLASTSCLSDAGLCDQSSAQLCTQPCSRCAGHNPLSFSLVLGVEYDSNVTLAPQFTGLGSGQGIEDTRAIVNLFTDYRWIETEDFSFGLMASQFGAFQFDAHQFDFQDYMGGFYANRLLSDDVMVGIRYEYHHSVLGYDPFAIQHRLVPNLTKFLDDGHFTVFYEFEHQDFHERPLIQAMDRDIGVHTIGMTRAWYIHDGDGRFFLGYRVENGDANGDDFDRNTGMVTARYERPLSECLIFDAEYRHFWDNYDDPNSLDFRDRARRDRRSEVRTGLQRILNSDTSLRLDYTYIDSNSNTANLFDVHFYDYDRHIVSLQYIRNF